MDPPDSSRRLEELGETIAGLERRVAALERRLPAPTVEELAVTPAAASSGVDLALAGRSLLVLAGAFLLRAIANLQAVPDALGVGLGVAYAIAILGLADRAAARGRQADSAWHGATSLLVAYPLVGESVLRFALLPAWAGSVAALAWFALVFLVAARRRSAPLAWIAAVGGGAAAVVLAFATRAPAPHAWSLIAMAAATAWLGRRLEQRLLTLPAALAGDLLILTLVPIALSGRASPAIASAPLCALAFFAVFAAAAMMRAGVFDRVQAVAALVVGLGGGAAMAVAAGAGVPFGAAALIIALAGSEVAVRRLEDPPRAFWSSLWRVAVLVALAAIGHGSTLALGGAAFGLALVALARRRGHELGVAHGVVALAVAAAAAGLLGAAWRGLAGPPPATWPGAVALAVLAAIIAAALASPRHPDAERPLLTRAAQLGLLTLLVFSAAGVVANALIVLVGASATVRTGVLAAAAVSCAAAPGGRLLVYPLLLAGAAKLVLEDFAAGGAVGQFAGLAIYGAALIVAPRLSRAGKSGTMRWKT